MKLIILRGLEYENAPRSSYFFFAAFLAAFLGAAFFVLFFLVVGSLPFSDPAMSFFLSGWEFLVSMVLLGHIQTSRWT